MKASKPIAFVVLAFLIGGAASQAPFAFADSSANPLQSIWDAIGALSSKQDDLQAQIDELRSNIENESFESVKDEDPISESSIDIELEGGEQPSETVIHLIASNSGPDNAVGVKVTMFYEMPLFDIQSMIGEQCEDQSRGIVQCFIGTIGPNEESVATIVVDAKSLGEDSSIVADISSITTDADQSNNHAEFRFATGELTSDNEAVPSEEEIEDEPNNNSDPSINEGSTNENSDIDENAESITNSTDSDESEDQSIENEQEESESDGVSDQGSEENADENSEDQGESSSDSGVEEQSEQTDENESESEEQPSEDGSEPTESEEQSQ